jgi:archaemetzincin
VTLERTTWRVEAVDVVPIGPVAPDDLRSVIAQVSVHLAVPLRLAAGIPGGDVPMLPDRAQADADRLLARLEARAAPEGAVLLGVTELDLGNLIFTHFFGRARQHGRAAIVSLARLTPTFYGLPPDAALLRQRAVLEVLHELGHLAGLKHCEDQGCLMAFAATVDALDHRGVVFCGACRAELPVRFLRAAS